MAEVGVGKRGIDAVLSNLRDIQKLNGVVRKIDVKIQSNGKKDSENPAVYGWYHDQTEKYEYTDPALEDFGHEVMRDPKVLEYFNDMISLNKKKRSSDNMDRAALLMAELAAEKVLDYILYEKPQVSQPWKRSGERNLIESRDLIDAIYAVVTHNGKEVGRRS